MAKGALAAARDLTAGDLARLLHVDLKTIHNWVNQGHVFARRTEGRHLRFQRVEVVRFLRRLGYPVPVELGRAPPTVLTELAPAAPKQRIPGVVQSGVGGLFSTLLEAAGGDYEVIVLLLDHHDAVVTRDLVQALRRRPETRSVSVIGVSRKPARRTELVAHGGDLALAPGKPADLALAARFLTGGAALPPRGALTPAGPR